MKSILILVAIAGLLLVVGALVSCGAAASGSLAAFSQSSNIRAQAEAQLKAAVAERMRQETADRAVLAELTRKARAEELGHHLAEQVVFAEKTRLARIQTEIARLWAITGIVVIVLVVLCMGGGWYLFVWVCIQRRKPRLAQIGPLVTVYLPATGVVLCFDERVPGLPVVETSKGVDLPALPPEVVLAAVQGHTQRAVALALAQAATARERTAVLSRLADLVEGTLGRPRTEVSDALLVVEGQVE